MATGVFCLAFAAAAVPARAFVGVAPFVAAWLSVALPARFLAAPFVVAAFRAPVFAAPFAFARAGVTGEPSVPSGAARREAFRAGRAAGGISAGRSARVRGATIRREV
jgi:hypothetical protein